jgi:hypothetical protein
MIDFFVSAELWLTEFSLVFPVIGNFLSSCSITILKHEKKKKSLGAKHKILKQKIKTPN